MTQITRHSRAGAAPLIAILAVVLFTGPPASAQSVNQGLKQVTVSFSSNLYIVQEGGTRLIEVFLSDDPGREVIIPITATDLGGASPADYSGVPQTVTFGRAAECFDSVGDIIQGGICYETSTLITITAAQDADDDGERVLLGFGAPLPAGVSAGWPATETFTISDGGLVLVGLAQVGIGVTAAVRDPGDLFGNVSNEAWQWQRSATEYGAYSDIAAAEGGTSNPYTPSAGDLGMWLKAKATYDVDSSTGQTAQGTTQQPVLSQAALSNASFAHFNELSYVLGTPSGTPITPLHAQAFTTGSANTNGYLLTAVRLSIRLLGLTAAGAWAVHADDAGKPAAQPLSAALPILNPGISPEHFTFREFAHPDGVRVDPDTKYWIVISQTTPEEDGDIAIDAWSEWTGSLEGGLAAPPVDPGSADGWSVDFEALSYYWNAPNLDDDDILRPDLLPWQRSGFALEIGGRMVLRMALRAVPAVTVQFSQGSYTVAEGATQSVTVTLSADPERTVVVPIAAVNQGTTSDADYSGVPSSVTFDAGEMSKSFAFSATQDTVDDDDESVQLGFGSLPDAGLSAGSPDETTVNITDDDVPAVTVQFSQGSYTVAEGATQSVTVTLSADPERTVVVPIAAVNQGTASDVDYSGVPSSVTFDAGEMSKSFAFSATQDTVDDDDESVQLGFGSLPDARVSAGTPDATTVNITDDDVPAVTVQFSQGSYTVVEGATQSVTVTLSADPERTVVVPITAVNQGTASDVDYSGVPSSVTFDAGEMSKSFTFSATQDTVDDDDESVQLGFGSLPDTRVSAGTPDATTVNITDDDVPAVEVSFGSGSYSVAEGSTVTVTVTLSAEPEREVTVPLSATGLGGADATDFSGVPSDVTFAADETSKQFAFAATGDSVDDDNESVRLSFGGLSAGVTAATPTTATVNIVDDDVPAVEVSFGSGSYSVAEGSTVTVTVTLSAEPEREVTVPLSATGLGGADATDFSGVPSDVTFAADETSKQFAFAATGDSVDDDNESVRLSFGGLSAGVTAATPTTATVAIVDDDVPAVEVSFGSGSYSVAEGSTVTVTVTLSAEPEREVTVPLSATGLGGADATDFSGVPSDVTFAADETSKQFAFAATGDSVDDDNESVRLSFGGLPAGVTAATPTTATVNIVDDDVPAVTVQFSQGSYTVAEGATQSVTVTLSADPERTVVVPIAAVNQGTTSDADYSGVPSSVTFDAGEMSKSFAFSATQDTVDDDDESVQLGFGSLPDAGLSAGSPDETTVNITDDDVPAVTVQFSQGSYTVAEGATQSVTVTLSADPERTVVVPIAAVNQGTASDVDYSGVPSSVTFDAGEMSKSFAFSATQDTVDDDDESVQLGFGSLPDARVSAGTPDATTVNITDDDVPAVTVQFSQGSYTVVEGATQSVTVTLSADPERTVVVPITAVNQGTASDVDYSGVPSSVTFDAGEMSKSFTFSATQDTVDDDDESVQLGFGSLPDTRVSAGTPDATTVNITDDDVPAVEVSFGSGSYSVAEGSTVTVTVTLSAEPEREVTVPLSATGLGGADATDFSGVPSDVTFAADETSKQFAFAATGDSVDDDNESVRLSFGGLSAGVTAATPTTATVNIVDDDVPAVEVSFGSGSYSVAEGSTVTVTVTLSAEPEREVTVPLSATGLGGADATDFSGVPSDVTFAADETSKQFAFAATGDSVDDDNESVRLSFGGLSAGVTAATPTTATVAIVDDDVPAVEVSFGSGSYSVAEGSTVTVTVTLSAEPEREVTVPLSATGLGGADATDFSGVPSDVTFAADETSKQFAFAATGDSVDDDNESVRLSFGGLPAGVTAATPTTATVNIVDDDVPAVTVQFSQGSYTVAEGATQSVTVTLSADPERTVVVPIAAVNQGTASDADYSGVPSSVTFDAGEMSKSFAFSATQDTVDDDDESVQLGFGSLPDTRVSAGSPDTTTVNITDDDVPAVTVQFSQGSYTVAEGATQSVTVTLSADPRAHCGRPHHRSQPGHCF